MRLTGGPDHLKMWPEIGSRELVRPDQILMQDLKGPNRVHTQKTRLIHLHEYTNVFTIARPTHRHDSGEVMSVRRRFLAA